MSHPPDSDRARVPERDLAPVAALIGDPTRIVMLAALAEGHSLPAGDLARRAGVHPATATAHLRRLIDGGLIRVRIQGRHRYHELAGPRVAAVIEALAQLAPAAPVRGLRADRAATMLAEARTCYDHLAGRRGVQLRDRLLAVGALHLVDDRDHRLTASGRQLVTQLGLNLAELDKTRRVFARTCVDWTQRRPHLAGALPAALTQQFLTIGWLTPATGRSLRVSTGYDQHLDNWLSPAGRSGGLTPFPPLRILYRSSSQALSSLVTTRVSPARHAARASRSPGRSRLVPVRPPAGELRRAWSTLRRAGGAVRVSALADEVGWSQRHLVRPAARRASGWPRSSGISKPACGPTGQSWCHDNLAICGYMCYSGSMGSSISVRDLRNTVSEVLRRVEGGERLTVTVDRRPVAEIVPLRRRRTVPAAEALAIASRHAADRSLLKDVRGLLADTTDDL